MCFALLSAVLLTWVFFLSSTVRDEAIQVQDNEDKFYLKSTSHITTNNISQEFKACRFSKNGQNEQELSASTASMVGVVSVLIGMNTSTKNKTLDIGSGSFKGARLRKKPSIRKTVSLPNTPITEDFKFNVEGNPDIISRRSSRNESLGAETTVNREVITDQSAVGTDLKCIESFDLGNLTSKGFSFLMDSSPVLSKSRTVKFHKLFKSVPDHEYPIDYFSCAFMGDILLQGHLYVSQNWFCFYSRIRGRGRLLEIPMESVISITREKTAIIFPNAIGLQTKKEKFAFASFISRDSTYKFLVSMWKKSTESKTAVDSALKSGTLGSSVIPTSGASSKMNSSINSGEGMEIDNQDTSENLENTNISSFSHSNSKSDSTDQSDLSNCMECGSCDHSDNRDSVVRKRRGESDSSPSHKTECQNKHHSHSHTSKGRTINHVRRKGIDGRPVRFPYSVMYCIDRYKTMEALQKSAVKLQKIPRTNLLLAVCTFLVLFLMLSAVGLTYKILDLEAKLKSHDTWSDLNQQSYRDRSYENVLQMKNYVQESTSQHMQNVLRANIKMLEEINTNLKSLHHTTQTKTAETSQTDEKGC